MRMRSILWLLVLAVMTAGATTLEQLALTDMIQQSSAIVRAKVAGTFAANRNGTIYTYYHLQVTESLKSDAPSTLDVAVPGGRLGRVAQSVAGAPELKVGGEYVLFLWTSKSGLTQIIGLSQGAFDLKTDAAGKLIVARPAISERMLDASGREVVDKGASLSLDDLRNRVRGNR